MTIHKTHDSQWYVVVFTRENTLRPPILAQAHLGVFIAISKNNGYEYRNSTTCILFLVN